MLHRGELLVSRAKGFVVYGDHHHVQLDAGTPFAHRPEHQLFGGLVIEHEFEFPACPVGIRYYTVNVGVQTLRFECAIRMGVHMSTDWESLDLGQYTFAFKCAPRP